MDVQPTRRMLQRMLLLLMLLAGMNSVGLLAQAGEIIQVCAQGCAYSDLREAVGKAPNQSTIFVDPGEYAGPVIIAKNLSIIGSDRNKVVIKRGVVAAGPFLVTLRNLTITGGLNGLQAQGIAGLPPQLSPFVILEGVTIAGNAANGLALLNYARATLCDVLITKNGISVSGLPIGGGVALRGSASIAIGFTVEGRTCAQSIIRENGANGLSAGDQSRVLIGANTVIAKHNLSGVELGGSAHATIQGLLSRENACFGVSVEGDASATITDGRLERNGKAGLHVGGPAGTLPGCATQGEAHMHATASVSGTVIAQNRIGVLVGDLSKDFEEATVQLTSLALSNNGCDLVVDPVAKKKVTIVGTLVKPCS